jgi:amidohydrolase
LFGYTQELRRDFHRYPELGFQEQRTATVISNELSNMGFQVHTGVAGTGIIALLEGKKSNPVIMLRTDIDALPIQEETGVDYASKCPGIMHACGHDGHIAVALTVAKILSSGREFLSGTVKFVFQPAEELLSGAIKMVDEGVLNNPAPDFTLAMHLWNEQPVGWFGISAGSVYAAGSIFNVRIKGKGGHGAIPQLARDPIITSAFIISSLQTIVSRNVNPMESGVVSVTAINAGSTFNVIPAILEFQGTIRAHNLDVIASIEKRFYEIVVSIAQSFGCTAEVSINRLTGPVINDLKLANHISQIARCLFPEANIDEKFQTMASEDFAYFNQKNPCCYLFVGSNNHSKGLDASHHDSHFDFDERALSLSVAL